MTGTEHQANDVPRKRRSERLTAGLVLAATLLVGVLLGVALDRSILLSRLRPIHGGWRGSGALRALEFGGRPGDLQRASNRMKGQLNLTDVQAAKIDTIMASRSVVFRAARKETETRVKAMLDTTRAMIDSVLTPTQRDKMREIRARRGRERRE